MTTASAKELREAAQLLTELAGDARSVKAPKIADTNELAAALCIERAEQMERGEQSFSDWLTSQYSIIDMAKRAELKAAWHAATAQMQARVNNAASVTNSFKEQLLVAKAKLDAATNLWTCKSCGARFDKIPHDDSVDRCTRCVEFDAAQKRVAELEARMELLAAWVRNEHSGASLPSDTVSAMIYIANERGKQHTHLIERLATAQVNVATQGFEEWDAAYKASTESPEEIFTYAHKAWHAAQAAMQAKLDAAEAENIRLREAMNKYSEDETLHTIQSLKAELEVAKHTEALDMQMHVDRAAALDAANERVKELEHLARFGLTPNGEDAREMCCREYKQELKAALATIERERELLRKEVRRCWELADKELGPPSDFCVYCDAQREDRPAEVRALVGTTADIKDT